MLFTISVIFLYETGRIQWMFRSALWILMAWCFSTRASVITVLTKPPCVSRCLTVREFVIYHNDVINSIFWQTAMVTDVIGIMIGTEAETETEAVPTGLGSGIGQSAVNVWGIGRRLLAIVMLLPRRTLKPKVKHQVLSVFDDIL